MAVENWNTVLEKDLLNATFVRHESHMVSNLIQLKLPAIQNLAASDCL